MSAVSSRGALVAASAAAAAAADVSSARTVFALDFDGVVCDSEPESSLSGWMHAAQLWPEVFTPSGEDEDEAAMARVLGALSAVRPVVETGFENTLLARALLEQLPAGGCTSRIQLPHIA